MCPYHAWTYDLDGSLAGVPGSASYAGLDKARHGLAPVSLEVWRGFVFVRLKDEGPGVAEMMAPYEAMIEPYRFEELKALGRVTLRHFCRRMRELIPEARQEQRPPAGWSRA